jgi:two-component system, chemotaxis family, protein-glutamate methylesterase/glutaminase
LSVLEKPINVNSVGFEPVRRRIIESVRAMASIKVIKRRFRIKKKHEKPSKHEAVKYHTADIQILAIGTSIGGPQALKTIFSQLPSHFSLPIVVVQHMTPGFISGFIKWLNDDTPLHIKEAENQELLQPGTIYFAPDYYHLEVDRIKGYLAAKLVSAPPVSGFCPSATVLLKSVAKICGKNAIGLLLTGMGNDGAQGLLELKKVHGHTLIQDQKSAVVFGMAGVAESLGAVDKILNIDKIAEYLIDITQQL